MRRHKYRDGEATATFEELTYKEQAQSITAQIQTLERAILANLRRARSEGRDASSILERRADQVQRLVRRLRDRRME